MPVVVCVDLYCGLGGWAEGFLAEGYHVRGYDIEAHDYGTGGYPGELILADVLKLHGRDCADAAVIVGSSPCTEYSYMAMPWGQGEADCGGAPLSGRISRGLHRLAHHRAAECLVRRSVSYPAGSVRSGRQIHSLDRGECQRSAAVGRESESKLRLVLFVGRCGDGGQEGSGGSAEVWSERQPDGRREGSRIPIRRRESRQFPDGQR
jgi:hypothetical protein